MEQAMTQAIITSATPRDLVILTKVDLSAAKAAKAAAAKMVVRAVNTWLYSR